MSSSIQGVTITETSPENAAARALLERVEEADGVAALSEQFLRGLTDEGLGHRHLEARVEGELAGLAACDGETAELAVHPDYRRRGIGTGFLSALGETPVWAHGDLPGARGLAARLGYRPTRTLLVLELSAWQLSAEPPSLPAGFVALPFPQAAGLLGREQLIEQWLSVNNEAFSWHPEQGGWDRARLRAAVDTEWFRAGDLWFLIDEPARRVAGFHWTKWHVPAGSETAAGVEGSDSDGDGGGLGEVYVIGLADAYRGRRLGDPLLEIGLAHLKRRGAGRVILYVEADNEAAVKAYRRRGFVAAERHVVYAPAAR